MSKAIILFSGGIDSTTVLYWARENFTEISTITFAYGQKHAIEISMTKIIAKEIGCASYQIELPLKNFLSSALLNDAAAIPFSLNSSRNEEGIPHTYVPFRNGIFLAIAAAFAESHQTQHLVTGFNCIDSPDYPDTTSAFTRKMQAAINEGSAAVKTGKKIKIHTPLIGMTKKEIIEMGFRLHADYSYSISCYRGNEIPCQKCPSCEIRLEAFKQLNMQDPLIARLYQEGKI